VKRDTHGLSPVSPVKRDTHGLSPVSPVKRDTHGLSPVSLVLQGTGHSSLSWDPDSTILESRQTISILKRAYPVTQIFQRNCLVFVFKPEFGRGDCIFYVHLGTATIHGELFFCIGL